jgi:hypothetical protein
MRVSLGANELIELGRTGKNGKKWARFGKKGSYLPGWSKKATPARRHGALERVTEREGCRVAIRRLVQLANVTKDQPTKAKARADAKWLHRQDFCKLKTKRK